MSCRALVALRFRLEEGFYSILSVFHFVLFNAWICCKKRFYRAEHILRPFQRRMRNGARERPQRQLISSLTTVNAINNSRASKTTSKAPRSRHRFIRRENTSFTWPVEEGNDNCEVVKEIRPLSEDGTFNRCGNNINLRVGDTR